MPRDRSRLDENGREVLDSTPMAPPVGYKPQRPLHEQIRDMVRAERALQAQLEAETFEEADDFDVGDDIDPTSPWEQDFEPVPVAELRRRAIAEAEAEAPPPEPKNNKAAGDKPASGTKAAKPPKSAEPAEGSD